MAQSTLTQVLFVVYCLEVGFFLIFAPWGASWDRVMLQVPYVQALPWLLSPIFRGAVCGFGLVHTVWGLHDLRQLLRRRLERTSPSPDV